MRNYYRTKYDFKNAFTKNRIIESFLTLYDKNELHKISIAQICDKAKIHRSTFYRHYSDIYDLLNEIEGALLVELRSVFSPFGTPDGLDESGRLKRKYLLRFLHCCEWNKKAILLLLGQGKESSFYIEFNSFLYKTINSSVGTVFEWQNETFKSYTIQLVCDIIISLMMQWLKDDTSSYSDFVRYYDEVVLSCISMEAKLKDLK